MNHILLSLLPNIKLNYRVNKYHHQVYIDYMNRLKIPNHLYLINRVNNEIMYIYKYWSWRNYTVKHISIALRIYINRVRSYNINLYNET